MNSVTSGGWVTNQGGWIEITVTEGTLDVANNRSQLTIVGKIINKGSGTSTHRTADITATMTGSDSGGDNLAFTAPNWAIGVLAPGQSKVFLTHTVWAAHDAHGGGYATCDVHYGPTGTTIFGTGGNRSATLGLTVLATASTAPGEPTFSNIRPTTLTVSWTPPTDNGGYLIQYYQIDVHAGTDANAPLYASYTSTGTTKNITGLRAGQYYTFVITAYNGHGSDGGFSPPSNPGTVQTLAGASIRQDGVWKIAIPYVRDGGIWKMAVPYIRQGGQWEPTH